MEREHFFSTWFLYFPAEEAEAPNGDVEGAEPTDEPTTDEASEASAPRAAPGPKAIRPDPGGLGNTA